MADILETRVLDALNKHGELTSADIANKLLSPKGDRSTVVKCLQRMTLKGLIDCEHVTGIKVYRSTGVEPAPRTPVVEPEPEAPEIDYSVRDEAGIAREWRKLAAAEGHFKRFPPPPPDPRPMTEIDRIFGDGSTIADMGHEGLMLEDIAANHGVKRTQLATWFAKHHTGVRALMAEFPRQEDAA